MKQYPPDPGGHLKSEAHRFVLAHLSPPSDKIAWSRAALIVRVLPHVTDSEDVIAIADELVTDGLAIDHGAAGYQQSVKGAELLNGPIANEPDPDAQPAGPALIGAATPLPTTEATPQTSEETPA